MPKAGLAGDAKPKFIIAGRDKGRIEKSEAIVQRAPPHRLWSGQAIIKEALPVKLPGLEVSRYRRSAELRTGDMRNRRSGVDDIDVGMFIENRGEPRECIRCMAIIRVRVC